MSNQLVERVIAVIAKTQHLQPETLNIDQTFEELKFDSLDAINIVFALESEFQVNIPDERVRTIRSLRELVDGIETLLAEQKPS